MSDGLTSEERAVVDRKKVLLWEFLVKRAQACPVGEASGIVNEVGEMWIRSNQASSALCVFLEVLGIDTDGNRLQYLYADERPRVRWAIKLAMEMHAGIVCSPFSHGWPAFQRSMDLKGHDIERREDLNPTSGQELYRCPNCCAEFSLRVLKTGVTGNDWGALHRCPVCRADGEKPEKVGFRADVAGDGES